MPEAEVKVQKVKKIEPVYNLVTRPSVYGNPKMVTVETRPVAYFAVPGTKFERKMSRKDVEDYIRTKKEQGYAKVKAGKGDSVMFWKDVWDFGLLKDIYPHLFSFAKEPNCSVEKFMSLLPATDRIFHLPLSGIAAHQLADLLNTLEHWQRDDETNDTWIYIWGSGAFSTKQAYNQIIGEMDTAAPFKWLWKSCCQGKHKVFFWLLLNDRLNTRNLLRRKRFAIPSVNCVMCNPATEETLKHLIFTCSFAQLCWTSLRIAWDLALPVMEMVEEYKLSKAIPS
ncbi:hypothetical protein EJB05_33960, partial [Eragrostis curvula]